MKNVKKYERLFLAFILLLLGYPVSTIQASETKYNCLYGERGELTDCLYSDGTNQKFSYDMNGNLINKYCDAFAFLGFDLRRVQNRSKNRDIYPHDTEKESPYSGESANP